MLSSLVLNLKIPTEISSSHTSSMMTAFRSMNLTTKIQVSGQENSFKEVHIKQIVEMLSNQNILLLVRTSKSMDMCSISQIVMTLARSGMLKTQCGHDSSPYRYLYHQLININCPPTSPLSLLLTSPQRPTSTQESSPHQNRNYCRSIFFFSSFFS